MKRSFFLLIIICITTHCLAQNLYYEPGINFGHYTPFSARHKYIADYLQYGVDIRIGKTTLGEAQWQQALLYPSYGLKIGYTHNTLDSVIYYTHDGNQYGPIGECFTLAGFVNGSFYKGKRWSFDYDVIYGADIWTRHGNEMLGSALNFHVSFDIGPTIRIADKMDLAVRYLYVHSSNGATFLPDNGVNSHVGRLALRYYPNRPTKYIHSEGQPFKASNHLFLSEGMGWLQTYTRQNGQLPNETPFFFGNTLRVGFARQFSPIFKWDAALDFCWTEETSYRYKLLGEPYNFWKSSHLAVSADFEILFGRFGFCLGGAYYLWHGIYGDTNEHKSWGALTEFEKQHLPEFYTPFYERAGYKLYFGKNNRFYAGTFMKIHLGSIDYIEWTIGANLL